MDESYTKVFSLRIHCLSFSAEKSKAQLMVNMYFLQGLHTKRSEGKALYVPA